MKMPKKLDEQQKKLILFGIILIALVSADYSFILKAQWNSLKKVSSEVRRLRQKLVQYKKDSVDFKNYSAGYIALSEKKKELQGRIISDSDLPHLMQDISRKADSAGVKIMQIKPQGFLSEKEKSISEAGPVKLYSLPIKLQLGCGYHQLGKFIEQIENSPTLGIVELTITHDGFDMMKNRVELSLRAYVTKK